MLRIIFYSTGAPRPPKPSAQWAHWLSDPPRNGAAALRLILRDGGEAQRVIYSFQHKGWRGENYLAEQSGMEMMTFICTSLALDKERRGGKRRQEGGSAAVRGGD